MLPDTPISPSDAVVEQIARSFPLRGALQRLPGGEGRTYRADDIVYRSESRIAEATFAADVYASIPTKGFHLPQPIRSFRGSWVSPDGWSAWSFVAGRSATPDDVSAVIVASDAFHQALALLPYPSFLATKDTPYRRANAAAWGAFPSNLDRTLTPYTTQLLALRQSLTHLPAQLVHGDLNPDNILIAPDRPPSFLDFTPGWYPPAFALAVFAYWIGPARGDHAILNDFTHIQEFDQLLLRVALSKLAVHYEFSTLDRHADHSIAALQITVQVVVDWLRRQR